MKRVEIETCFGPVEICIEEFNTPESMFTAYSKNDDYNGIVVAGDSDEDVIHEFKKSCLVKHMHESLNM